MLTSSRRRKVMNSTSKLQKRFDLRFLNFRSWLQQSLSWWRRKDRKDKSLGYVWGSAPGCTWFSCHADWVRDLILHLCRWIKCPSFHVFKFNWAFQEGLRNKWSIHVKLWETRRFFVISTYRSNFMTWTSFPLSFLPKRGCTWRERGCPYFWLCAHSA